MTTLVGPMTCIACRAPVWIVRRTIVFLCASHSRLCTTESNAPTVADEDGATHLCQPKEHARSNAWYDASDGSSVINTATIGDGRSIARPSAAAVPCLEV